MSGGHFNYSGDRVRDLLHEIADDSEVKERFPHLSRTFKRLGDSLYDLEHDLDWDLSKDHMIQHDRQWETYQLLRLLRDVQLPYELEKLLRR